MSKMSGNIIVWQIKFKHSFFTKHILTLHFYRLMQINKPCFVEWENGVDHCLIMNTNVKSLERVPFIEELASSPTIGQHANLIGLQILPYWDNTYMK